MPFRVGIDLASVDAVEQSLSAHGDAYLARVYTPRELDHCRGEHGVSVERLAARFAAKEAAIKVLRPSEHDALAWSSIEVVVQPGGWVALELTGAAARLAAETGIEALQLSITHEGPQAAAVVVAEMRDGCR